VESSRRVTATDAHYADYYADPGITRWREIGAVGKAENIVALCTGERISSVLEIGCGDGAVIAELARREFATSYLGVDISPSGIEAAKHRGIPHAEFAVRDVADVSGTFGLAVLSHVIEHVENPRTLLRHAARVAPLVFVEVPLEFRELTGQHFVWEPTGHINMYEPRLFRHLLESTDLTPRRELIATPPRASYEHLWGKRGRQRWRRQELGLRLLGKRIAPRFWIYHMAALCERR
jgi:SAM-dependent methyltransferase